MNDLRIEITKLGLHSKQNKKIGKSTVERTLANPFYYGYMQAGGLLYKHGYDPLITKELFDACQKVTEERAAKNNRKQSIQTAKEGKDFIFKSLVKCGTSGRIITCDRKDKGRIKTSTYLMPWNPENPKKKLWVNENEILAEIEKVFKSMQFPKEMLEEVRIKLQGAHDAEKDYYKNKINELNNRLGIAHAKLDRLVDMKLSDSITEDMFARKRTEIEKEIANLKTDIAMHDIADEKFKTLVVTVFSLASRVYELFEKADLFEKRELINCVCSNIILNGKNPDICLRKPFNLMVNLSEQPTWLPSFNIFRNKQDDILSTMNRPMMEGVRLCLAA